MCIRDRGSLVPRGGHNLIEPAMHKCAIIYGPDVSNHQDISDTLIKNNASIQIKNIKAAARPIPPNKPDDPTLLKL